MTDFAMFQLDERHAVGMFFDKNGDNTWQMITTKKPIVDNVIDGDAGFELCEIDPNDFEFDGVRMKIVWNKDVLKPIVDANNGDKTCIL